MSSVVRPCSYSISTTHHIGVLYEWWSCSSFSFPLHALASFTANRCWLEFQITGTGVSHDTLMSAPFGMVGGVPGRIWLVDRGPAGSRLASLFLWDPTSARSHAVRPLGGRQL